MVPQEVFRRTCSGIGLDYDALTRSELFRKEVQVERNLLETELGSLERMALRMGSFRFGRRLNPFDRFEGCLPQNLADRYPDDTYDAEERVLLRFIGRAIVDSAKGKLSPKLVALAERYRIATTGNEQIHVLRRVCYHLKGPALKMSVESHMRTMRAVHSLPNEYRPWNRKDESDEMPNCLGKGQLLIAFCELAGITDYMSIVPIRPTGEYITEAHSALHAKVLELCPKSQVPNESRDRFYNAMESSVEMARYLRERPSYPHFPIALKIKDGRWAVLDPNFARMPSLLPKEMSPDNVFRTLNGFKRVAPGIGIAHQNSHMLGCGRFENIFYMLELIAEIRSEFQRLRPAGDAAIDLLANSKFFTEFQGLIRFNMKFRAQAARKKRKWRKEAAVAPESGNRPKESRTLREAATMLLLLGLPDFDEVRALSIRDSGEGAEYLCEHSVELSIDYLTYYASVECLIGAEFILSPKLKKACSPQVEFGQALFQVACYTVYHVGVDMKQADEVTSGLMDHWYGMYPLHNAASLLLRRSEDWSFVNRRASLAAKRLRRLPFRLQSSEFLLSLLEGVDDVTAVEARTAVPGLGRAANHSGEVVRGDCSRDRDACDLREELPAGAGVH